MFNKTHSLFEDQESKVIRLEVILSPTIVAESRKDNVSVNIKKRHKNISKNFV